MSGGTWGYDDFRLFDLAERVAKGAGSSYALDRSDSDLPRARAVTALLTRLAGGLLHELDWHFAGDATIGDEDAWLHSVRLRLDAVGKDLPLPEGGEPPHGNQRRHGPHQG